MKTVVGTVSGMTLDELNASLRRAAAQQRFSLDEAASDPPNRLVFRKGVSLFSWGAKLMVELTPAGEAATTVSASTKEVFSLVDWGRGKRACHRLLDAVGASTS